LIGGARNGRVVPGAAEQSLLAGIEPAFARRAAVLADQLVNSRIGGTCWANAPKLAGTGLTLIQASADGAATTRMLHAMSGRADPARVILLLREDSPSPLTVQLVATAAGLGFTALMGPHDPWPLLDRCAELHTADGSAIGFLALLTGHPVHCHGPAWLAGWGLTRDQPGVPARTERRNLTELAAAALLTGATYANPFNGQAIAAEAAADIAAEWRRVTDSNRAIGSLTGMQFWKRRRMAQFLHTGVRSPRYFSKARGAVAEAARLEGAVAVWSSRMPGDLRRLAATRGVPVVRVEDGFIRSVGLGSNFLPPCSIILDSRGIYYDPSKPSDLEHLIATVTFDHALVGRASRLIQRMVRDGVTKYNVGANDPPAFPPGRRRLLVPGQVANDLSVRLGGAGIVGNDELLRRVRVANPDAFIVYKPHPDVDAGHRPGSVPDHDVLRIADIIVRDVSMAVLIDAVDELHTLTSLAGFEALLRGKRVVTWGQPFYAGWGLTDDMAPVPRRTRRITVEQLAACVLLLYPRYVDPATGMPCPVEILMDRLTQSEHWRPGPLARLRQIEGAGHRRVATFWRAGCKLMMGRRRT
jgi:capsular polysaccharide export protein